MTRPQLDRSWAEMTQRFTIRTLLVITALIAGVCGIYAQHATIRADEQRGIDAIVQLVGPSRTIVSEPGATYQYDGSIIYLRNIGPAYGGFYGFDVCRRVTDVHFIGDIDPRVVDHLSHFGALHTVTVTCPVTIGGTLPPHFSELLNALREFRDRSPSVGILVKCTDPFGKVVWEDK